ncbi:hypothetical protein F5Y15DRAFT_278076 [Xylariaceae sp. FL0016]|nr:hypothetical protein F5Y15DRAFT_278076 [Xylariaceae sp. FL0016]
MSATASAKINTNGKRLAPPGSHSTPSPGKSEAGTPSKRQKRDGIAGRDRASTPTPTPAAIAQQQAATDFGSHMMTQLTYAVDFLKAKGAPKTLQEVLAHLTLDTLPEQQQKVFVSLMQKHSRIQHVPPTQKEQQEKRVPAWRAGKYQFKAKIPGVHDKISLLAFLQRKTDASSLSVKDLKDGWPDCDGAITELERDHKILVVRTRKDNHAKFVWLDDPSLAHPVDSEFQSMWHKTPLPSLDDIVRKLQSVGQKPASEDPRLKKLDAPVQKAKKRKNNKPPKHQSNSHMAHLLKDYSHLKR